MRKRIIDPVYWSDDKVIELEPIQRLLFIGMWNFADDSGVLKNSSKQLKAQIFPADNISDTKFKEWLNMLYKLGLILLNKDKTLIKIKGWSIYQKINRPQPSKYKFTEGNHGAFTEPSLNNHGTITTNRIEENRKETNRKEKKGQKNLLVQTKEGFEQFYDLYPRKVKPHRARKAYNSLTAKEEALAIKALPIHIKNWADNNTEMQHIPHPSTWLNLKECESVLDTGTISCKINKDKEERDRKAQQEYYSNLKKNSATQKEVSEIIGDITKKLSVGKGGRS